MKKIARERKKKKKIETRTKTGTRALNLSEVIVSFRNHPGHFQFPKILFILFW